MLCRDENGPEIYDEDPKPNPELEEKSSIQFLAQVKRKVKKKLEDNRQIMGSKGRFFRKKLRIQTEGLTFGMCKIIFILLALVFETAIIQYFFYTAIYPDARRLKNLINLYTIGTDAWNTYYLMHHTFLATILWNNTVDYYGHGDSRKAYE